MPTTVTTGIELYDWLSELDGSNPARFRWNPSITQRIEYSGNVLAVDRVYPLGMSGKQRKETWTLKYETSVFADTDNEYEQLRYLVETRREAMIADGGRQAELLYRSRLGPTFRCLVKQFTGKPLKPGIRYQVSLTLERVN